MDQIAGLLDKVLKPRYEEDFVDRLNYKLTAWLLLMFSVTLAGGAYVGKPVQCWVPAQFTGGWEQYVEDYCFVENTYWLPFEKRIPTDTDERDKRMLNYYQWVPFVLALQALMFMAPHLIWRMTNWLSSVQVRAIIGMASDSSNIGGEAHTKAVKMISSHIHDSIKIQTEMRKRNFLTLFSSCGMAQGLYVTIVYLIVKLLFIANLVLQFFILQSFLGPKYTYWGADILGDLATNTEWHETGHFPRVTLCDFMVRRLGNLQRFSVQCVLMINMFNEKVFLFLWWWFLLVIVVTILNFFYWAFVSFVPGFKKSFIERMLNAHGLPKDRNRKALHEFIADKLRPDGVLVLRLMARNAGEVTASHVVKQVWLDYMENTENRLGYEPRAAIFGNENGPDPRSEKTPFLERSLDEPDSRPYPKKDTSM